MDRDQRLVDRQECGCVGGPLAQRHDGQHADDADDDGDRFEQTHEGVTEGDAFAVLPDDRVERRGGTYFPNKAAVLRGVVERILGEVEHDVFVDAARPWRERVESLFLHLRERVLAHPAAVPLMVSGPMDGRNALTLNEQLLELLCDAGLSLTEAARASYLLVVYVFGSMALNVAHGPDFGPLPPEADRVAARRQRFSAIPESFPRSAAAADTTATFVTTEQFLWGLRRLLDGITARRAQASEEDKRS